MIYFRMQNDCEIYVDPEEDEVFFGCMSEREKNISSKLVKCAEPNSQDCKSSVIHVEDENVPNLLKNEQSTKLINEDMKHPKEIANHKDLEKSSESTNDSVEILSNSASVELDHSYSTPMKHKIDKTILTTPKSVVKADRDGGFLKVLSEIALVKAEAEGDKEFEEKKGDEDKENKIVQSIPEIKITEATPEKGNSLSPPRSIKSEIRRFRIIYNSPQSDDNISHKSKFHSEAYETERNLRNKCLDQETESSINKEKQNSVDLIDFNDSYVMNEGILLKGDAVENLTKDSKNDDNSSDKDEAVISNDEKSVHEILQEKNSSEKCDPEILPTEDLKLPEEISTAEKTSIPLQKSLRFSKEARKILEVLKKSVVDDTLDFTILEMDHENENSFLSPDSMVAFDDTIILNKTVKTPLPLKATSEKKPQVKSKTVEKERNRLTPVVSHSRLQPLKYFSERKLNKQDGGEAVRCAKKLPMEGGKSATVKKVNGGGGGDCNAVPTSRIPVFGSKNSKIPVNDRLVRPLTSKSTPSRTTSAKSCKNYKFNHIESPINAYIHNKPTSLVQNIRPEVKKDCFRKAWKVQTTASATKIQGKTSASAVRLPYVEYKSGTPYNIEKRSESRLPRLAPTVLKLIGSNSPKVLKHEGRFYMKTPRKENSTDNSTIVAEPNEVSVVVSHSAQKSCTFK